MTKENAKEFLPLVEALIRREKIEAWDGDKWVEVANPVFSGPPDHYRIKPRPKFRPWRADEVPVGALLRRKDDSARWLIVGAKDNDIAYSQSSTKTLDALERFEHSTDGGLNWKPCGVEE